MVRFGVVSLAPAGADSRPQAGMIKMADGDARVAGGGGIFTVARGDGVVGGHLARGRELHGGSHVHAANFENAAEGFEGGGQTDLRVAIADRDGGTGALRARQKRSVDLLGEE